MLRMSCLDLAKFCYKIHAVHIFHTDEQEQIEKEENNKETSVSEIYLRACKLIGIVPVSYFIRNLDCTTMTLSHHGLGPLGCEALAIALTVSVKCFFCIYSLIIYLSNKAFLTSSLFSV